MEGTNAMTALLEQATSVLTWVISSMGNMADFIMETPILLVIVVLALINFAFGSLRKLFHTY